MGKSKFTEEEKQFIEDNYPTMGIKEIAMLLGKPVNQIKNRIHNSGLYKDKFENTIHYLTIDNKQLIDFTGEKFGKLTVVGLDEEKFKENESRRKNDELKSRGNYWLCKCDCGNESLISVHRANLTSGNTTSCGCFRKEITKIRNSKIFTKSFYQWCIENDHQDYLELWDYKLNDKKPEEVGFGSEQLYYFKCTKGIHESETKRLTNITKHKVYTFICSKCNSFAQWGIDNICPDFLEKYWDYDKNNLNPWEISYGAEKKIWIKCQCVDYHDSYEILCSDFRAGKRCPYCSKKRVHKLDSLASIYPNVIEIWSDKNKKSPYEIAPSAKKAYWFKCKDGVHDDFKKEVHQANRNNFGCPICAYSQGERRILDFLSACNVDNIPQKEFDGLIGLGGGYLKFDFYITNLNTIIEYDGIQHYEPVDFNGFGMEQAKKDFKKLKYHDELKNEYCKIHNIKLIRIPYWDFDNIEEILVRELRLN